MSKILFFVFVGLGALFEIIADILFKKWVAAYHFWLFIVGLFLYMVGTVFWAISLKYEYLSKAVGVYTVLNLLLVALVGMLFFKEDLTVLNKLGLALGVISIILIEI
jgi:multidrug transporter EmrE-like cation transporter